MKLHAVYDIESDIFSLSSFPPTSEMLGDEGVIYTTKSYDEETGKWMAVMKDKNIAILSRDEYVQMFGSQEVQFDKEAYFIKD